MFKDRMFKFSNRLQNCGAVVAILLLGLVSGAQAQTLEIMPANLQAYEPVILRVTPSNAMGNPQIKMKANRITVTVEPVIPPPLFPAQPSFEAYLGQLPAGNYEVEVISKTSDIHATSLGVKPFIVTETPPKEIYAAPPPLNAYTDIWWDPANPGWAINITAKNRQLFATWLTYDNAGRAVWLTIQDVWPSSAKTEPRCYRGRALRTTGPALGGILGLSGVDYFEAGTIKFCFSEDNQSVQFTYTVDGVSNQKTLYRQPF